MACFNSIAILALETYYNDRCVKRHSGARPPLYRRQRVSSINPQRTPGNVYQVTQACHAADSKLGIKYRPSFQFVVVQKAVSARFVSPQYASAAPGTIVDTQLNSNLG
eukprot:653018_1